MNKIVKIFFKNIWATRLRAAGLAELALFCSVSLHKKGAQTNSAIPVAAYARELPGNPEDSSSICQTF
ncbi:MAG: hypothetical protein SNJ77_11480 [Cytophagales bacterium]